MTPPNAPTAAERAVEELTDREFEQLKRIAHRLHGAAADCAKIESFDAVRVFQDDAELIDRLAAALLAARRENKRSAVNPERLRLIAIELEKFADQGGRGHPDALRRDAEYLRLLASEHLAALAATETR